MKRVLSLLLMLLVFATAFAHSVEDDGDVYRISHSWKYKSDSWSCSLTISKKLYEHYKFHREHRGPNMAGFALSDYDRECLRDLVEHFREAGKRSRYSDYDNVYNVVAFVQSLAYISDLQSTGEKEYVRFPIETLVDGGGDCEDTSVLMAAILHEMGYGVVLLSLPNHIALGVKGDNSIGGTYYLYENQRYYYLETTDKGWSLGEIPDKYQRTSVTVLPLVYKPDVLLKSYQLQSEDYDNTSAVFKITCDADNRGPGGTAGLFLHVMAYRQHSPSRMLAEQFLDLEDLAEGQHGEYECRIVVPRTDDVVFELRLSGQNCESNALKSKVLDLR